MTGWDASGIKNTENTVRLALERAAELDIQHIAVASNTGYTARNFTGSGRNIVCVTHHVGFKSPGEDEMTAEERQLLAAAGVKLLTTTHLFAGVDRGVRNRFGGVYPAEIMAQTLRIMGHGVKVCVEIAVMALDAGLIPHGVDVISIAGTGRGADTAILIRPAHSNYFFDTKVREIICKPIDF